MKNNIILLPLYLFISSSLVLCSTNEIARFIKEKYCTISFAQHCACICADQCTTFECPEADISTSARVTAIKSLYRLPIDPVKDFPGNVANFTATQQEDYRAQFTRNSACALGNPVGWKLALGSATPANPTAGYTTPAIGQLLSKMIICGPNATISNNYAVLPFYEVDLLVRVSNIAINNATTPQQILENIDAVMPAYELAAGFTSSFDELVGPALGGNSLLVLLNGAARLVVTGTPIPVLGSRTIKQWQEILSGNIQGKEVVSTRTTPLVSNFNNADFLLFAQRLINKLNEFGYEAKPGDLLSLGSLTGLTLFTGNETAMSATFTNLDPNGPVMVNLTVDNTNGVCLGDAFQCF